MKARCFALAVALVLMLPAVGTAEPSNKVTICHRPPDNPGNVQLLTVSVNALPDHLAHGDHLSFGGSCYSVEPNDLRYATSEQACIDLYGGHLASIHSQAENDFVGALVDPDSTCQRTARIGGYAQGGFCLGPDASYTWSDGTAWDYWHWRGTTWEPNCTGIPGSTQFWPDTCGYFAGWNDVPVGDALDFFVCKYQP